MVTSEESAVSFLYRPSGVGVINNEIGSATSTCVARQSNLRKPRNMIETLTTVWVIFF